MKSFIKVFVISFICFTLLFLGIVIGILNIPEPKREIIGGDDLQIEDSRDSEQLTQPIKEEKEFGKLIKNSERVNILLIGMEGPRTDTLILASCNLENKKIDLISIPRDTYYETEGYTNRNDYKKINAVYGFRKEGVGGIEGLTKACSNILKVPIHYYVSLSYKGVENIIDCIGGVQVNIPFPMYYDDPYSDPPLHIHFEPGTKVLNGKDSIKFLRFRENNDKSYARGDLGRIEHQKQFMKSAAKKAMNLKNLPSIVNTIFKFTKTNLTVKETLYYTRKIMGGGADDIETYTLPGEGKYINGTSYYIHNSTETQKLMIEIYKKGN